jgi:hypothetical protein
LTKILSPQETASALLTLLRSPALMRECGKAGRDRAEQFYSMKSMLQSYRDLYLDLMSKPKSPPPRLAEPAPVPPPFGRKSRLTAAPADEPALAPAVDAGTPGAFGKRVRGKTQET